MFVLAILYLYLLKGVEDLHGLSPAPPCVVTERVDIGTLAYVGHTANCPETELIYWGFLDVRNVQVEVKPRRRTWYLCSNVSQTRLLRPWRSGSTELAPRTRPAHPDRRRRLVPRAEVRRLRAIHRLRPLILAGVLFVAATPASAATSHAKVWTALDNDLDCGVAIHPPDSHRHRSCAAAARSRHRRTVSALAIPASSSSTRMGTQSWHAPPRTPSKAPPLSRSPPAGHGATSASHARSRPRRSAV